MLKLVQTLHYPPERCQFEKLREYSDFEKKFIDTLNKYAPRKIKTFRGNQKPHINKTLRKAIMKRLQLKKLYFKL